MLHPERRMLISLAHPDDESFGLGGTIARYVHEGVSVSLICATNGDVGTVSDEHLAQHESVAALRISELECATQVLGIDAVYRLNYRDSGVQGSPHNDHPECLARADISEVAERIAAIIRLTKPHVVVTFDPFGGYGHPDHIVMHRATTKALELAADPNHDSGNGSHPHRVSKLYYRTMSKTVLRAEVRLMELLGKNPGQIGRNNDIDLAEIARHQFPVHARLHNSAFKRQAAEASRCHASQLGGLGRRSLLQVMYRFFYGGNDTFMRAIPSVNGRTPIERDLFAGIQDTAE